MNFPDFDSHWKKHYEWDGKKGYRYGRDALEQVRFGYNIAVKALAADAPPAASEAASGAVGVLREALTNYLEAQDALDNWETSGPNRGDYGVLMRRRNIARKDLDAALASTAGATGMGAGSEIVLWQYRWTNPSGEPVNPLSLLDWKEVEHPHWQPLEMKLRELRDYRFNSKPCYEVRGLCVAPATVLAAAMEWL